MGSRGTLEGNPETKEHTDRGEEEIKNEGASEAPRVEAGGLHGQDDGALARLPRVRGAQHDCDAAADGGVGKRVSPIGEAAIGAAIDGDDFIASANTGLRGFVRDVSTRSVAVSMVKKGTLRVSPRRMSWRYGAS